MHRVQVALAVSVAFACLFAFLFLQQSFERSAPEGGAFEYLVGEATPAFADPLGISSQSLELVGVSHDGMVVGYATDGTVAQAMAEIDRAMRMKGWSTLAMSIEGTSSYIWQEEIASGAQVSPDTPLLQPGRTPCAYVLFICSERDGGSSVVAELL
jgi:hypothetical protein